MNDLDPIEQAREQLGLRAERGRAVPPATPTQAAAPPPPAQPSPKRPFLGKNGQRYERRASIAMTEWLTYTRAATAQSFTVYEESYWVALFLGRLDPQTINQSAEERYAQAEAALADMPTDDYFAIAGGLFDDIMYPANPNDPAQPAEAGATTPEAAPSGS